MEKSYFWERCSLRRHWFHLKNLLPFCLRFLTYLHLDWLEILQKASKTKTYNSQLFSKLRLTLLSVWLLDDFTWNCDNFRKRNDRCAKNVVGVKTPTDFWRQNFTRPVLPQLTSWLGSLSGMSWKNTGFTTPSIFLQLLKNVPSVLYFTLV